MIGYRTLHANPKRKPGGFHHGFFNVKYHGPGLLTIPSIIPSTRGIDTATNKLGTPGCLTISAAFRYPFTGAPAYLSSAAPSPSALTRCVNPSVLISNPHRRASTTSTPLRFSHNQTVTAPDFSHRSCNPLNTECELRRSMQWLKTSHPERQSEASEWDAKQRLIKACKEGGRASICRFLSGFNRFLFHTGRFWTCTSWPVGMAGGGSGLLECREEEHGGEGLFLVQKEDAPACCHTGLRCMWAAAMVMLYSYLLRDLAEA